MDIFKEFVKENIKKYRLALKKEGIEYCSTQESFAKKVGIPFTTYKKYEAQGQNVTPDYRNLVKIATALKVSIDSLFNYHKQPQPIGIFLTDLNIDFKTKFDEDGQKQFLLTIPNEIKNDFVLKKSIVFTRDKNGKRTKKEITYKNDNISFPVWVKEFASSKEVILYEEELQDVLDRYNQQNQVPRKSGVYIDFNPFVERVIFFCIAVTYPMTVKESVAFLDTLKKELNLNDEAKERINTMQRLLINERLFKEQVRGGE